MIQLSVAVRNARLDAIETTVGVGAKLQIWSGAMPANCAAAATGTKLLEDTLASDWAAAASGGSKVLNNTPITGSGLPAAGAGTQAGYFRITDSSGSTCHEQGTVSVNAAAWAAGTAVVVNQYARNSGNIYQCTTAGTTAGTGGPSGTGTGISDGTAVWSYVSAVGDMTIDNPSIASGQTVTVTSFSMTDGNA
ncbi:MULTISPECIES: hypothetical protein [unclassified Bradyrhizobium]|uniref:hypothetical protein n=1 Tax=unclassified Bradyrhizobium TaxID=2631580 RepID=UPI0029164111|nr:MULTISPECIES: hypothetical protein [unclassified Bradyrhizobium]